MGRGTFLRAWTVGLGTACLGTVATAAVAALGAGPARAGDAREDLAAPYRVEAAGAPIDVEVGHAAPWVGDWDGDGTWDLLVGQFGGGKLRIYRNEGTAKEPRFDGFVPFKVGESEGTVPAG